MRDCEQNFHAIDEGAEPIGTSLRLARGFAELTRFPPGPGEQDVNAQPTCDIVDAWKQVIHQIEVELAKSERIDPAWMEWQPSNNGGPSTARALLLQLLKTADGAHASLLNIIPLQHKLRTSPR